MALTLSLSLIVVYMIFFMSLSPANLLEINAFHQHEQDSLMNLRNSVGSAANLLQSNWTGQPCFYNESRWFGVVCSNGHIVHLVLEDVQIEGAPPRSFLQNITFLRVLSFRNNSISGKLPNLTNLVHLEIVILSHNGFTGYIPIDYIGLPKLKELHLQDNFLTGRIPPFDQPTLVYFNVSYNHLRGEIPRTRVLQRFPKSTYDHNSALVGCPLDITCLALPPAPPPFEPAPAPPHPRHPLPVFKKEGLPIWGIALIATASALVVFSVLFAIFCYYKRKHGKGSRKEDLEDRTAFCSDSTDSSEKSADLTFFNKEVMAFELDDLLRASSKLLGHGNLGTTYKASMEPGSVYTVKGLFNMSILSRKQFIQQMKLLGRIKCENLVEIIAIYCSEEKLVIYEHVSGSSLFELLHGNRNAERSPLDWTTRLAIIKDIAKGLLFLHQSLPSHKVPHANLKSSNVLIHRDGRKLNTKLTDYGFLPLLSLQKMSKKLAVAKAPEFVQLKKLTPKADVYCFGIVLLEILTGIKPGEITDENDEVMEDLSQWVRMVVDADWSTDILDVELQGSRECHNEMLKLTEVALECTNLEPWKRPQLTEVLTRIEEITLEKDVIKCKVSN